jgi:RNA polymerase sigma factor (sigma-70 family)
MENTEIYSLGWFNVSLGAVVKNANLVNARKQLGLPAKRVAESLGICYGNYLNYEYMKLYPQEDNRKKICDFFIYRGIPVSEEELFPKFLKDLKLKGKYVVERPLPQFIPLSSLNVNELPSLSNLEEEVGFELFSNKILNKLNKRERKVLEMRFGLSEEKEKSLEEIGNILSITRERVRQIEVKAFQKIRNRYSKSSI